MLGNRDGEVLSDGAHRLSKVRNKNEALRSLLGDDSVHTHVSIDYVPSLQDWKTAWDFVHFEGFLGTRMSLQFTWTGSDSALAAPLVLDLIRLADFAMRGGRGRDAADRLFLQSAALRGHPRLPAPAPGAARIRAKSHARTRTQLTAGSVFTTRARDPCGSPTRCG